MRTFACAFCNFSSLELRHCFIHSNIAHARSVRVETGFVATCIYCLFTHSSCSVVKLHTELAHSAKRVKLYYVHPRTINIFDAIREDQLALQFETALRRLFQ